MNRLSCLFIVALVTAGLQTTRAQQNNAQSEKLLASAQHKATVDGDLKGAIEEYTKIVASAGNDRALAAQALVRMAECYQKLGDVEARKVYGRVLRDYGDQKDAVAVARAGLGERDSISRVKGDRQVWAGPGVDGFGTISPDGRFLTYVDWNETGGLFIRDLTAGTDRALTKEGAKGGAEFSVISKSGKEVVYEWYESNGDTPETFSDELRISNLQGTGIPASRQLFAREDINSVAPFDWSADGRWLAVQLRRKDRTGQIGLISLQDGSLHVLKSTDWKSPTKIFFSPDGRYIAYDLPVSETTSDRHVFVMATDGSRETDVVADPSQNVIMGWSPEGRRLLFASDRSGSMGLWAIALTDGRPDGVPSLLKADIGSSWSLGLTAAGTLYTEKPSSAIYVQVAPIDLAAGKLVPNAGDESRQFIGSRGRPDWSPDGKYLAYTSCSRTGGGPCVLLIRSMETGRVKELPSRVKYFQTLRWSPDAHFLIIQGTDIKGRRGIYRIDSQTGDSSEVVMQDAAHSPWYPEWAADGKGIYYRQRDPSFLVIVHRDLASGAEQEVLRTAAAGNLPFFVSPDRRLVAFKTNEGRAGAVLVIPFAGGEVQRVLQLTEPETLFGALAWTQDSRALIVAKARENQPTELWLAPLGGAPPHKFDGDASNWIPGEGFRLSPDGKQVAFVGVAGKQGSEIWALENFLPSQTARR